MNVFTGLEGTAAEGDHADHYPVANSEPADLGAGKFGALQLTRTGLILRCGKEAVAVPMAELLALLGPALREVKQAKVKPPKGLALVDSKLEIGRATIPAPGVPTKK